jgi:hypothetical protein
MHHSPLLGATQTEHTERAPLSEKERFMAAMERGLTKKGGAEVSRSTTSPLPILTKFKVPDDEIALKMVRGAATAPVNGGYIKDAGDVAMQWEKLEKQVQQKLWKADLERQIEDRKRAKAEERER